MRSHTHDNRSVEECGVAGEATTNFPEQLMGGQTITAALFDCPSSAIDVEMAKRLAMICRKAILELVLERQRHGSTHEQLASLDASG